MPPQGSQRPSARWERAGETVTLVLAGEWRRDVPAPDVGGSAPPGPPGHYDTAQLGAYDSTLPAFILAHFRHTGATADAALDELPEDLRGLMKLALATPEEREAREPDVQAPAIERLGHVTLGAAQSLRLMTSFTGETVTSLARFLTGKARFRGREFWAVLQACGPEAMPIVLLINFLVGLILAFVGNVQLANFGASLYVADLVGIAVLREMGVVMTAIIISGRTGAAFAAHIGSMKANQEIDALRTFGFNPFDYLVLPRMIALVLMMPVLTVYANLVGILGGMIVAAAVGIPPVLYWNEIFASVSLTTASLGVFKSVFFGAAIAISGCLQGMQAGNSSAAVGQATTRAVVAAITAVIVIDCAFAVIFTILDI